MGIKRGDKVYFSGDLRRVILYFFRANGFFEVNHFIDAIINVIGDQGTVAFPTFNWDFCKGKMYDYHQTLGMTGAIGNHALSRKDFRRTKHPIYSFAVWGKDQEILVKLNNKGSFSLNGPFGFFYKNSYKNLFIDTFAFTFIHFIEQQMRVNFRYNKAFISEYKVGKSVSKRKYYMFVRPHRLTMKYVYGEDIKLQLIKAGAYFSNCLHGSLVEIVDLNKSFRVFEEDLRNNGLHSKILEYSDGK